MMTLHRFDGGKVSRLRLLIARLIVLWLLLVVVLLVSASHPIRAECSPSQVVPITSGTGDTAVPLVFAGLGIAPEASFFLLGQGDGNNSGRLPADAWLVPIGDLDGDGFSEYRLQAPGEGPGGWGDPRTRGCPATAIPTSLSWPPALLP